MERDRPRWRMRISTLMLLVIIDALASALVVERRKRMVEVRRALLYERARWGLAQAELARQAQVQAVARAQKAGDGPKGAVPVPPRETSGRATQAAAEQKECGP
jgi:hypothetical protein